VIASPLRDIWIVADNKNIEVACCVDDAVSAVFCQDDSLCRGQQVGQAFFGLMKSFDRNDNGDG
jgi:hypothetical protein